MPSVILEQFGYVLWEGFVLVCVVVVSLALVMLRRKMRGRPALTSHDWKALFKARGTTESMPKFCLRFAVAVFLFSCLGLLEVFVFAQLGAAILSVSLLVSCAGIVNIILL
jgi:preprotein translocase subunit SecG